MCVLIYTQFVPTPVCLSTDILTASLDLEGNRGDIVNNHRGIYFLFSNISFCSIFIFLMFALGIDTFSSDSSQHGDQDTGINRQSRHMYSTL